MEDLGVVGLGGSERVEQGRLGLGLELGLEKGLELGFGKGLEFGFEEGLEFE